MKKFVFILIAILLFTAAGFSQDTLTKKQWRKQQKSFLIPGRPWTIEAPLWVPGFAGSFAYGDIDIEGEDGADPENPIEPPGGDLGKIISRLFTKDWYLKFFFLTKVSYEKNRFELVFDALSGAVRHSTKFKYNNEEIVQANFRTTNMRLFAGYKLVQVTSDNKKFRYELFGYLGARAYFQNIYSDLNGAINELDIHPFWIEPVFGLQNQFTFKRWYIVIQGDYGGLFQKSKFSAQFTGFAYYRTGNLTSLKFGWNHLAIKQRGVFLKNDYKINVTLSGPSIGLVFHF
ncbi:MAG: hypothetical protein L3J31_03755 [Bacteroidales bacterium]|nr:hypothetical protein [Bacteroidales bacterium]